jgi:hypothetical protein
MWASHLTRTLALRGYGSFETPPRTCLALVACSVKKIGWLSSILLTILCIFIYPSYFSLSSPVNTLVTFQSFYSRSFSFSVSGYSLILFPCSFRSTLSSAFFMLSLFDKHFFFGLEPLYASSLFVAPLSTLFL